MAATDYIIVKGWQNASLRKAKTEAKKQTGVSCCIHESLPYGRGSRIVCFAPASGFTPP